MALSPFRFRDLETVRQKLSQEITSWKTNSNSYANLGLLGGLFVWQTVSMARVSSKTNVIWTEGWATRAYGRDGEEGMIEEWRFKAWCETIGLKVV